MRIPDSLVPLVEHGVVGEVFRSLKSGKEADVFLVSSEGFYRVAKVYKDAQNRSFQNRAAYVEGRTVRNSRDQRAMNKGTRYGRAQNEAAWQSAEVDTIYRLDAAGVRVPKPFHFIDGVLIMEMVADAEGQPAPRLGECQFTPEEAKAVFDKLLADVARMLCNHVVHGDLSEYNVLVSAEGPVIIDFPQSVNAAKNPNARKMLWRDVENLKEFLRRFAPATPKANYAEEMWHLYERGELTPETQLTGKHHVEHKPVNTSGVMELIDDARRDHQRQQRPHPGKPQHAHRGPPRQPQDARAPGGKPAPHHAAAKPHHAPPNPQHAAANPQHAARSPQPAPGARPHHGHPQGPRPPAGAHVPGPRGHGAHAPHPPRQPPSQRPHNSHPLPPHSTASPSQHSNASRADSHASHGPAGAASRPHAPPANQSHGKGPGPRPHPGSRPHAAPRQPGGQGHHARPPGQPPRPGPRRPPAPVVETRPPQLVSPPPPRKP